MLCADPFWEKRMQARTVYASLKILNYIVVLLMVIAIGYSALVSLEYWTGIAV